MVHLGRVRWARHRQSPAPRAAYRPCPERRSDLPSAVQSIPRQSRAAGSHTSPGSKNRCHKESVSRIGVHPKVETSKLVTVLRKENRYGRKGRVFPLDYKLTVVRRWNAGESVSAMARELGIRRKVLYEWKDRYRKLGEAGLRPAGRPKASSVRATGGGGRCQSRQVADGAGADWGVGAQGGATGAGIGLFRRGLAANPGGEARRTRKAGHSGYDTDSFCG